MEISREYYICIFDLTENSCSNITSGMADCVQCCFVLLRSIVL